MTRLTFPAILVIGILFHLTVRAGASEPDGNPAPLAGEPPYRRLFLDATVVEESQGLTRTFHTPEKHPDNPLLKKEHAWEGWGPYVYGTVLWNGGKVSLWYQGIGDNCADVSYAESSDGLHWTRPALGIVEYAGSKANNIVAPAGTCHIPSVIRVPHPSSPDRQWVLYGFAGPAGAAAAYSPDGLHWNWNRPPEQQKLFETSDVTHFFYDPYQERFTATYKTVSRRHRAVGVAVSENGLKWRKPVEGAVFCADDLDPDATQIYGMPVFPYQGLYIGLPWIYHARWIKYGQYTKPEVMYEAQEGSPCTMDVQLAWSWDLLHWTRPPGREPFLGRGPADAFDSQMIFTAREPLLVGDRLFFYYSGFDRQHDAPEPTHGAIGLAILRLDGFCSMQAGDREGWLISRREVFNTPRVQINARCAPGGQVSAELLDRHDRVLPGFSRAECVSFTGDSVRHTLTWKTESFPPQLIDKDKKVRFYLRKADLFAYLPIGINPQVDEGRLKDQ